MNKYILIIIIIALIALGFIYWVFSDRTAENGQIVNQSPVVTSGENPEEGGIHDLPVEPSASIARKDLASKLGVAEKSIVILQITDTEWSDGCLGLGKANESCIQSIIPGFRVELLSNGKSYFYRTDKTGVSIRAEN